MKLKELKLEIANRLNYKLNEKFKIIHGVTDGYACIIAPFDNYETTYNVIFCVSKDGNTLNKNDFESLKKDNESIARVNINNNRLIVMVKNVRKVEERVDRIVEVNKIVVDYLKNNGYNNIDEITKDVTTTSICNIKGVPQFVSISTLERLKIENPAEDVVQQEENVVKGIIGGVLGSLIGVASIILFGKLGFIAAVSGFAMGVCTILGYKKFAGNISKKGIIISIIIMAVMTYLGVRLSATMIVHEELSKIGKVDFFAVFEKISDFVKLDAKLNSAYIRDIILTYVFTAAGAFGVIKGKIYEVNNANVYEEL